MLPSKRQRKPRRRKGEPPQCQGVDIHADVRKPPLTRCKDPVRVRSSIEGRFCARHERQHERQVQLLGVLKPRWWEKLVSQRGKHSNDERNGYEDRHEAELEARLRRQAADLPESPQAPAVPSRARTPATLPTFEEAYRKLTGG